MGKKKPKARQPKSGPRTPKTTGSLESTQGETPHFCFHYVDRKAREPWAFQPGPTDAPELFEFICEMARLTWREIEHQRAGGHRRHHGQLIGSIATAAQGHIQKHRLDEIFDDSIFRFRVSGEKRLWGFRSGRVFHVLWWDPDHKVYETEKN